MPECAARWESRDLKDAVIKDMPGTGEMTTSTGRMLRSIAKTAREIHPGFSIAAVKRRVCFICRAVSHRRLLKEFCARMARISTNGGIQLRSDVFGVTEWPYINKDWDVAERLDRIARHYEFLASSACRSLCMDPTDLLRLVDLSHVSSGCQIVIDRAHWFKREGELLLNLFKDDLRVASIAFIFGAENGLSAIFVGAVQGIHKGVPAEQSLEIFKTLTKEFEGLRPRSLLLEVLRMIGNALGVKTLFAVADENRHHHHRYFGAADPAKLGTNYNEIWIEHGGTPSTLSGFYDIPMNPRRKELAEIPAKKRAMYRRRYAILEEIQHSVATGVR
jgi:uncharacterized protein VirK/YbjX